mgnify:CR=1 FL=1
MVTMASIDALFKYDIEPGRVAAIILEPILGEGGFLTPPPGFLTALRAVLAMRINPLRATVIAAAIGLPLGQAFTMTNAMTYTPAPAFTFDAALTQAYAQREDLKSAQERTDAADASVRAASYARLPTIHVEANYGKIGNHASDVLGTYSAAAVRRAAECLRAGEVTALPLDHQLLRNLLEPCAQFPDSIISVFRAHRHGVAGPEVNQTEARPALFQNQLETAAARVRPRT